MLHGFSSLFYNCPGFCVYERVPPPPCRQCCNSGHGHCFFQQPTSQLGQSCLPTRRVIFSLPIFRSAMGCNIRTHHAAGISRGRPTHVLERSQSIGHGPGLLAFVAARLLPPCTACCAIFNFGDAFIVMLNVILKIGLSNARCSQAGWCFFLGFWAAKNATRFSREGADCFFDFGAHRLCLITLLLAAQSSLFLLMLHALLSRVVTPGKSIFLDASVRKSSFTFYFRSSIVIACVAGVGLK